MALDNHIAEKAARRRQLKEFEAKKFQELKAKEEAMVKALKKPKAITLDVIESVLNEPEKVNNTLLRFGDFTAKVTEQKAEFLPFLKVVWKKAGPKIFSEDY